MRVESNYKNNSSSLLPNSRLNNLSVGNVFNRLVLFNSKQYRTSLDFFGNNKENGM